MILEPLNNPYPMHTIEVPLGALKTTVTRPTMEEAIEAAGEIFALNEALLQEGITPDQFIIWIPYTEIGPDNNRYTGFRNVITGQRIRLGKRKDGKLYPRLKTVKGERNPRYRGIEEFGPGRQLMSGPEKKQLEAGVKAEAKRVKHLTRTIKEVLCGRHNLQVHEVEPGTVDSWFNSAVTYYGYNPDALSIAEAEDVLNKLYEAVNQ